MLVCKCNMAFAPVNCVKDECVCDGLSLDWCVSGGEPWPPLYAAVLHLCCAGGGIVWRAG